ncbi:hypothetical protein D3C86_1751680 [compost metagenome]
MPMASAPAQANTASIALRISARAASGSETLYWLMRGKKAVPTTVKMVWAATRILSAIENCPTATGPWK